ncbi:MAG: hypothetical protein PHP53_07345 [Prolixibacteraceae bacterium]|nr:hypothetical protein [Prolixibacteraceae bacterium]
MNEITIQISGFPVHLSKDASGQYKANVDDLCSFSGLKSASTTEAMRKLYQFLIDGHFEGACKWVSYNEDILCCTSRKRILRFLLTSASCILLFGISQEHVKRDIEILCDFISGLNQHQYNINDIVDLIISEGCNIDSDH